MNGALLLISGVFMLFLPAIWYIIDCGVDDDHDLITWLTSKNLHQIMLLNAISFVGMLFINAGMMVR